MAREREVKVKILGDSSSAQRALGTVTKGTSKFGSVMKSVGRGVLIGGGLIGAGLAVGAKAAADAAIEAERVSAQTSAALKSTGRAAGINKEGIESMAQRLMNLSGVSDETIQSGENMLLTFTNIKNEIDGKFVGTFDRATQATLDLSVAMDKDMKSSALLVGKALNDPVKGATALSRAGVQLTEQQKEQIATMTEAGDVAGAQGIILDELATQFGGSAEAMGKTAEGQFNIAKESVGNFLEVLGAKLLPVIADVAQNVADFVGSKEFQAWFDEAITFVKNLISTIIEFAGPIVKGLIKAVGWVADAIGKVFGSGGSGREAVGGFVQSVRNFIGPLIKWWKGIWPDVKEAVKNVFNGIRSFWKEWGDEIKNVLKAIWDAVKGIVKAAIKVVQGVIETVLAIIRGDWGDAWNGIKKILSGVWDAIKSIVGNGLKAAKNVIKGVLTAIKNLFKAIWDGIKSLVDDAVSWIIDRIGDLAAPVQKLGEILDDILPGGGLSDKQTKIIGGAIGLGNGNGGPGGGGGGKPVIGPGPTRGRLGTTSSEIGRSDGVVIPYGTRVKVDFEKSELWFARGFEREMGRAVARASGT